MVDLLRANARLCGLPVPDPSWGYQSYHQGWKQKTSGEAAVPGLDVCLQKFEEHGCRKVHAGGLDSDRTRIKLDLELLNFILSCIRS